MTSEDITAPAQQIAVVIDADAAADGMPPADTLADAPAEGPEVAASGGTAAREWLPATAEALSNDTNVSAGGFDQAEDEH